MSKNKQIHVRLRDFKSDTGMGIQISAYPLRLHPDALSEERDHGEKHRGQALPTAAKVAPDSEWDRGSEQANCAYEAGPAREEADKRKSGDRE
jgi:hypothetical protein